MRSLVLKLALVFGFYLAVLASQVLTRQPPAALVATSALLPTLLTLVFAVPEALGKLKTLGPKNGH